MFIYHSRFLTRGEVWFDDEPDGAPVDWIYYRQRPGPVAGARWKFFYTLLFDLEKGPAQLLSEMDARTVQKIEAAEKNDQTCWEVCDPRDRKLVDTVEEMWNESAAARNVPPLDRPWLDELSAAGALDLSATRDPEGGVLTYHLSYVGKKRAQDLIAISPHHPVPTMALRNKINRANCLGHWKTMLALKTRGLRQYDFGGWYPGTSDLRLLGMNAFKKSFGGQVVREYDCEQIQTFKGWIVLMTARMLQQTKIFDRNGGGRNVPPRQPGHTTHATAKDCEISPAF